MKAMKFIVPIVAIFFLAATTAAFLGVRELSFAACIQLLPAMQLCHGPALDGIVLAQACSAKEYLTVVEQNLATLHTHLAYAHLLFYSLQFTALCIEELHIKAIEVRRLGIPKLRVRNMGGQDRKTVLHGRLHVTDMVIAFV